MKKIFRIMLCLVVLASFSVPAMAQKVKIGHIDVTSLMEVMPGRDTAEAQLKAYYSDIQAMATEMQTEIQAKVEAFQLLDPKTTAESVLQAKYQEIEEMQARYGTFEESAQQDLVKKEQELTQPFIDAIQTAIDNVAETNGYSYIVDTSTGVFLYATPTEDVSDLVKVELGIE